MSAEQLVIDHMDLAGKAATRFGKSNTEDLTEREEYYAVACEALVKAAAHYNPTHPSARGFEHYALTIMYNKMIDHLKWSRGHAISLYFFGEEWCVYEPDIDENFESFRDHRFDDASPLAREDAGFEEIEELDEIAEFARTLSDQERFVLHLCIEGLSQKKIAEAMKEKFDMPSCSQPYVAKVFRHIRAKRTEFFVK